MMVNGPMPTTAAPTAVTTGTAIKTLLQIKPGSAVKLEIVEWGISFDGSLAGAGIKCELLETGTVFATVTAAVANDFSKQEPNDPDPTTSLVSVGTSATGYTATAEGTITATRLFDLQFVDPSGQYVKQFPLGVRPVMTAGGSVRIRVTAATAVNAYCYIIFAPVQ
jgi:hypothetical protein